jgi:hypothetical protein
MGTRRTTCSRKLQLRLLPLALLNLISARLLKQSSHSVDYPIDYNATGNMRRCAQSYEEVILSTRAHGMKLWLLASQIRVHRFLLKNSGLKDLNYTRTKDHFFPIPDALLTT